MAVSAFSSSSSPLSLCFVTPTRGRYTNLSVRHQRVMNGFQASLNLDNRSRSTSRLSGRRIQHLNHVVKAIEEEGNVGEESEAAEETSSSESSVDELGREMKEARKAAMKEEEGGQQEWWSGVAEEIREIEWPAFGKVVGTTGVVLGVIAGSSVVLLTVNAVLAELSDRVFVGRGVQDFFG